MQIRHDQPTPEPVKDQEDSSVFKVPTAHEISQMEAILLRYIEKSREQNDLDRTYNMSFRAFLSALDDASSPSFTNLLADVVEHSNLEKSPEIAEHLRCISDESEISPGLLVAIAKRIDDIRGEDPESLMAAYLTPFEYAPRELVLSLLAPWRSKPAVGSFLATEFPEPLPLIDVCAELRKTFKKEEAQFTKIDSERCGFLISQLGSPARSGNLLAQETLVEIATREFSDNRAGRGTLAKWALQRLQGSHLPLKLQEIALHQALRSTDAERYSSMKSAWYSLLTPGALPNLESSIVQDLKRVTSDARSLKRPGNFTGDLVLKGCQLLGGIHSKELLEIACAVLAAESGESHNQLKLAHLIAAIPNNSLREAALFQFIDRSEQHDLDVTSKRLFFNAYKDSKACAVVDILAKGLPIGDEGAAKLKEFVTTEPERATLRNALAICVLSRAAVSGADQMLLEALKAAQNEVHVTFIAKRVAERHTPECDAQLAEMLTTQDGVKLLGVLQALNGAPHLTTTALERVKTLGIDRGDRTCQIADAALTVLLKLNNSEIVPFIIDIYAIKLSPFSRLAELHECSEQRIVEVFKALMADRRLSSYQSMLIDEVSQKLIGKPRLAQALIEYGATLQEDDAVRGDIEKALIRWPSPARLERNLSSFLGRHVNQDVLADIGRGVWSIKRYLKETAQSHPQS